MFGKRKERGKATIQIADCTGCGNCIEKCRHGVIEFVYFKEGRYARIKDNSRCSGYGKCANVCEYEAIRMVKIMNYEL
ncbi:MAG: 4Fe-4S dicluster domain-containing protein [Tannerellaceae bacterium]|jgi:ferredoxin|nr:4Fe-4S dicluster domain-containing protein [Tannerellaceae bacterium]